MAAPLQADYSDILESSLWELQACVVLVSLAGGGAVAFHQCYVGHFGVLEEHSQNAHAVSAML